MGISTERTTQIHQTKRWNRIRARSYLATNAQKGTYNTSELNWVEHQGEMGTPQQQNTRFKFWGNLNSSIRYGGAGMKYGATRSSPVVFGGGGAFRAFARMDQSYNGSGNQYCVYVYDYDDNLWGWGGNNYGHFGHGDTIMRSSPVILNGWNSLGPLKMFKHSHWGAVGVTTGSDLYVCGYNYYGRWGFTGTEVFTNWDNDGNYIEGYNTVGVTTLTETTHLSKPVRIAGKWKDANLGDNTHTRINDEGQFFIAGYNHYGIFGNNESSAIGYSSPVTIPGKFRRIVENTHYNVFLENDKGQTMVTGNETSSWFGKGGPSIPRSSPVAFPGTWARIVQSIGAHIMTDYSGNIWGVGLNNYGQLGLGDNKPRSRPVLMWSGHPDGTGQPVEFNFAGQAYGHYFLQDDDTLWGVGMNYSTGTIWTSSGMSGAAAGWYLNSYWSCQPAFLWTSRSFIRSFPCFVNGGWNAKLEDPGITECNDPWKYSRLIRAGSAGLMGFHVPGESEGTVWSQHYSGRSGESDVPYWNLKNRDMYTWHDDDVEHQGDFGYTPS
jgi:hypothetical protein